MPRRVKMLAVSLFKIVSALTPDDVKEMKAVGCEDDVKLDSLSCNRASRIPPF